MSLTKEHRTQVVLQWATGSAVADLVDSAADIEARLHDENIGFYEIDGHDIGSGTLNVFLFALDFDLKPAIKYLIELCESGKLPSNCSIGVAQYADEARATWVYRPVYPPGLTEFRLL